MSEKIQHALAGCCAMGLCGPEAAAAVREQTAKLKRKANARIKRMSARHLIKRLIKTADGPRHEKYSARLDARRFLELRTEGRAQ